MIGDIESKAFKTNLKWIWENRPWVKCIWVNLKLIIGEIDSKAFETNFKQIFKSRPWVKCIWENLN